VSRPEHYNWTAAEQVECVQLGVALIALAARGDPDAELALAAQALTEGRDPLLVVHAVAEVAGDIVRGFFPDDELRDRCLTAVAAAAATIRNEEST